MSLARKYSFSTRICRRKKINRDESIFLTFSQCALCDQVSSRKRVVCKRKRRQPNEREGKFARCKRWTTTDRFWGCKNFFDHYNATPSLEATIVRSEALMSCLIINSVLQVTSSYKFLMAPRQPAALFRIRLREFPSLQ